MPVEGMRAHACGLGHVRDGPPPRGVSAPTIHHRSDPPDGPLRDRPVQELRLTACPLRGHHQTARHRIGGLGAEILPHDVGQQVDARRTPGRGQDASLLPLERAVIHGDGAKSGAQGVRIPPVGRRRAAIQKPGRRQHERTRADRRDPRMKKITRREMLSLHVTG